MAAIPEELLTRGVAEIIVESELRAKLNAGKKLRLKQGFDPSRPDMHIGHAVGLRKLKKFQELGHTIVLIVGDWTAQIGDPSGRDVTRPRLTAEKVRENALTYMEQFFRVIDRDKTEIRWQSEWFGQFKLENALDLAGRFTLAHMLSHDTFRKRYEAGQSLTILELMYPMLQGYDSVVVKADVEFGGTDQKFNNLAGRELQAQMGQTPQDVFLLPLIPGTDGRKMGKSFDNTVDILLTPENMFGKIMSMADDVMPLYYEVLTDVPLTDVAEIKHVIQVPAARWTSKSASLPRLWRSSTHPAMPSAPARPLSVSSNAARCPTRCPSSPSANPRPSLICSSTPAWPRAKAKGVGLSMAAASNSTARRSAPTTPSSPLWPSSKRVATSPASLLANDCS
jgi:tyrosyl-tRNA synthetase